MTTNIWLGEVEPTMLVGRVADEALAVTDEAFRAVDA